MLNKVQIFLCWFDVNRNWLQKAIRIVQHDPARRKALLQRCNEVLHLNPGVGTGVIFQPNSYHMLTPSLSNVVTHLQMRCLPLSERVSCLQIAQHCAARS